MRKVRNARAAPRPGSHRPHSAPAQLLLHLKAEPVLTFTERAAAAASGGGAGAGVLA